MAVLVVHSFGQPANMDAFLSHCRERDLLLIEDASHALGSKYHDLKCGTLSDFSFFSFHGRKTITTGEGGMLCTNNEEIASKARVLRDAGQKGKGDFITPGYNMRMSDVAAALGLSQLKRLNEMVKEKIRIADHYNKLFYHYNVQAVGPATITGVKHSYQSYVVYLARGHRDEVREYMRENGVETQIGSYAISKTKMFQPQWERRVLVSSKLAYERTLALPCYNGITAEEMLKVAETLQEAVTKVAGR